MTDNSFGSLSNENREEVVNASSVNFPSSSVFPYGRSSILAMNEGYLYPVDCFFVQTGDVLSMDMAAYLETLNPFVSRQYSGMKLCFHVWYQKCEHEWKGWKNYATKGRRGNIKLSLPYVQPFASHYILADGSPIRYDVHGGDFLVGQFDIQNSLCSYLVGQTLNHISNQIPSWPSTMSSGQIAVANSFGMGPNTQVNRSFRIGSYETAISINAPTSPLASVYNAIPFSMYQRIFRDEYLNQNLVKDNPYWFPDDEDDFVLPYAGGQVYSLGPNNLYNQFRYAFSLVPNNYTDAFDPTTASENSKYADHPILASMRCRQWSGDPFTTSVPFLERNGTTHLFQSVYAFSGGGSNVSYNTGVHQLADLNLTNASGIASNLEAFQRSNSDQVNYYSRIFGNGSLSATTYLYSILNLNQLRELSAATLWSERNAKARGDYNSLIMAHYGRNPNSEDRSATYVGGFVQRVDFDNVVSNSTSQYSISSGTVTEPLGSITSRASCGAGSSINNFQVPDFGFVMVLASLVPDTFYTQGLRPEFDASLTGAELPWPEFANLQKENVLMKRLFYFGDPTYDLKLIGFNERFLDYKYRNNVLLGHFADSADQLFRSMTFARYFDYTDMQSFNSINNEFVTLSPYNCRSDMYSVPSQPHFVLQFGDSVRLVRALPYAAKESALTNIA